MEGDKVAEERILVQEFASTVASSVPFVITRKEVDDSVLDVFGDVRQVHLVAGTRGTFATRGKGRSERGGQKTESEREGTYIMKFEP